MAFEWSNPFSGFSLGGLNSGLQGLGLPAGVANSITGGLGSVGGQISAAGSALVTNIQMIGAITTAVGLARIAPNKQVSIDGKPAMHQLSFLGFIKDMLNTVKKVIGAIPNLPKDAIAIVIAFAANIEKLLSHHASPGNSIVPITNVHDVYINTATAATYNFLAIPLQTSIGRCEYYGSTATTTLLSPGAVDHWNRVDIEELKTYWTSTVQLNMLGSTVTNQNYYFMLNYALAFTNALCDTGPADGIMSLSQIIEATSPPTTFKTSNGSILTATVETLAGTLYSEHYVTSATNSIYHLVRAAENTTTTISYLTTLKTNTDNAVTDLMNRIIEDQYNQANFMANGSNLSAILGAANKLANIQSLSPGAAAELYKKTIHPDVLDAVVGVTHLINLTSSDPNVQAAAYAAISTSTYVTTSTVA
jgi:hypothetical protein